MTPALDRILDDLAVEAPEAVARGRRALARALGWLGQTRWPEVAWAFSGLASGSPLELVWRPGRPGLFWTAEPAAPELPRQRRLCRGLAILRANGAGLGRNGERLVRRAHAATRVDWPLFIAGRHEGQGADSGKAYLHARTLPEGFADLGCHLLPHDRPILTGVAGNGLRELYWERRCQPGDLWRMRQAPGSGLLAERLDIELIGWTGHGLDHERRLGLSLAAGPDGRPLALAAFLAPRMVTGGETSARVRLLAQGGEANPALARAWEARRVRPMLLTLGVTATGSQQALGFRLPTA
jgi:hypothetical protein